MKRLPVLILCLLFSINTASGASLKRPVTKTNALNELSRSLSREWQDRRDSTFYKILNSQSRAQQILNADKDIEFLYLSKNNRPIYAHTDNLNAALTVGTINVWPGGGFGFNLDGSTTTLGELGIWDAGAVRASHQEFGGRVTQMDGATTTHYHATHVAGTMVASGVVGTARGMSYAGTLAAYDWGSAFSEMATAAAGGMNISNHSWGYVTGWYYNSTEGEWYWYGDVSLSTTEDAAFGMYESSCREIDSILFLAPYKNMVVSAGNERNDYGPTPGDSHYVWTGGGWNWSTDTRDWDGGSDGYDCISYFSLAKNIICVGAINDIPSGYSNPADVTMSSFSSWGPTDDGRIKPDIVANGVGLYSTMDGNNTDYASLSGTSMSAPNTSGSLNLLVRYFEASHGSSTPLASTIKGVVIQTADEAGANDGPDYSYGWGLLNTLKAAQLIQDDSVNNDYIWEDQILDSETKEYYLTSDGVNPIKLTVCWTDPAGPTQPYTLNPTDLVLVNDLDMRLENTGTLDEYFPYVLDPSNPINAATTGDNFRDNVEQIFVDAPPAGSYKVTITHKSSLTNGQQNYSLISSTPLSLSAVNSKPILSTISNQTINELDNLELHIQATDSDGDSLFYNVSPIPTNAAFVDSINGNGSFTFTPDTSQSGTYDILFIVSDTAGSDSELVTITVNDINAAIDQVSIDDAFIFDHLLNHTPQFGWGFGSPNIQTEYEIEIGTDNEWTSAEMWSSGQVISLDTFAVYSGVSLLDGATYYGRVRTNNGIFWTDWFEFSFSMNSKPTIGFPISPLNDIVTNSTPTLWVNNGSDSDADPLTYTFALTEDPNGTATVTEFSSISETSDSTGYTPSPLVENSYYMWKVKSSDSYEDSDWSDSSQSYFWVNANSESPIAPATITPVDTISYLLDLKPTFDWTDASDPDPFDSVLYDLYIAENPAFLSAIIYDSINASEYTLLTQLIAGEEYWWKVAAYDIDNNTIESDVGHFWTPCCIGDRGNVDGSASEPPDISDLLLMVDFMFLPPESAPTLNCEKEADVVVDGTVDISDLLFIVDYMFATPPGDAPPPCE